MGEARFGLVNDLRFGERRLPRMVDRCVALALPRDADAPARLPLPELKVPGPELAAWRERLGLASDGRPVVALAPGAVGPSKRWPTAYYADLAQRLAAEGAWVWVIGGPGEKEIAAQIVRTHQGGIRDLTGPDLRNAILALAAANAAVSNDSGLLHVAAALGTPAVGIFGPTSPWHWAPLNPIAAVIETDQRAAVPAMSQAGLPPRPPSVHAGHFCRSGERCDSPSDSRLTGCSLIRGQILAPPGLVLETWPIAHRRRVERGMTPPFEPDL